MKVIPAVRNIYVNSFQIAVDIDQHLLYLRWRLRETHFHYSNWSRRMKRIAILLLFLTVTIAYAQDDRGTISGLVEDSTGAVISNAAVVVTNEDTGVTQNVTSDAAGAYTVNFLIPGVYTVSVSSPGFKTYSATHVRVAVASRVGINAKLSVGEQSEVVTVQGTGGARLETETASLGFTIEARSAQELPLQYSNPFELQLLAPGVNSTTLTVANHTYEGGSESAKVNGAQSGQTEFTLDGAPDSRNGGAVTTAYIPSKETLGEFKLITSPYDASVSHTSGGSLDASMKSGTSKFHGGGTWYFQPPDVDSPAFALGNGAWPVAKYNRETAEVDGPILSKKLFFMAGWERQFNQQAASTTTQTVPTDAEKTGDFSALLLLGSTISNTVRCKVGTTTYYAAPYNSYQIFNPFSTTPDPNCAGQVLRTPYTNNIIPNIDSVAKNILSYFPEPTGSAVVGTNGTNNYVSDVSNVDHYWSVATRLDYQLSPNQKLFGHFITSKRVQPGKNSYYPGASGQTLTLKNYAEAIDYVNTLNATTVLNARFSYTRFTTVTSLTSPTTATDLGVNANALAGANPKAAGFPQVKITGYATLGNSDPGYEADNIPLGLVSLSKTVGRHDMQFGAEWRDYKANKADLTQEHLSISATGSYMKGPSNVGAAASAIGQGLAGLEAGLAESTAMTLNAATASDTTYWSGFFQDNWKANPKLTINLGLRYEYGSPIQERHNKSISAFAFNTANPIATQAIANYTANPSPLLPAAQFKVNGGFLYAGTAASPSSNLWTAQKANYSPRIGFAWNPIDKLVVRGGFGIFFSQLGEYVQYGNPVGYTQTTNTITSLDSGVTVRADSLDNPFPSGLTQPSGNSNGMLQSVGTSISGLFNQNPKSPYNERYSLSVQYQLPGDMIAEADYVGNTGQHIRITRDYNPVPNSYLSTDSTRTTAQVAINAALVATPKNPFYGITVPGSSSLTGSTITQSQLLKPYPEFTGITQSDPSGFSSYNALQLSLAKRFSHGYNMSVAYAKSRSLDAISFLNAGDAKPWYGVSNGDYPQMLSVAAIYELPFGRNKQFFGSTHGVIGSLIRGFQVEGTYRIQSGQPLTFNNAAALLRPGYTLADIGKNPSKNYKNWFNTRAFINNLPYTPTDPLVQSGDGGCAVGVTSCPTWTSQSLQSNVRTYPLRFNNVRQDYQDVLNVGAMKKFIVRERYNMAVRAEAFNALNHPIYNAPSTDPSSTSFGQVTGFGNASRVLQFSIEGHF
jgi:hypothetical protein